MVGSNEMTPLCLFVETWLQEHETNGSSLFSNAGLPNALYTQLKRGSSPRPNTLRALADEMKVPRGRLFMLAGYCDETDLTIIDPDPEIEEAVEHLKRIHGSQHWSLVMRILSETSSYVSQEDSQVSQG